jgi:hypothetical protein
LPHEGLPVNKQTGAIETWQLVRATVDITSHPNALATRPTLGSCCHLRPALRRSTPFTQPNTIVDGNCSHEESRPAPEQIFSVGIPDCHLKSTHPPVTPDYPALRLYKARVDRCPTLSALGPHQYTARRLVAPLLLHHVRVAAKIGIASVGRNSSHPLVTIVSDFVAISITKPCILQRVRH